MIVTSIEQSKHLLELGLKPETADMCYKCLGEDPYDLVPKAYSEWKEKYQVLLGNNEAHVYPAWSLAGLENVMPSFQSHKYLGQYCYEFIKDEWSNGADYRTDSYDNPIDAAYEMVCWLIENGYFKRR